MYSDNIADNLSRIAKEYGLEVKFHYQGDNDCPVMGPGDRWWRFSNGVCMGFNEGGRSDRREKEARAYLDKQSLEITN